MLELINNAIPYNLVLYQRAWEVGVIFLYVAAIAATAYVIYIPDASTQIQKGALLILSFIIMASLLNPNIGGGKTPIELFVRGTDALTIQIAVYLGGDPITIGQEIWDNYAKQMMDSKAFSDTLQSSKVDWLTKLTGGAVDMAIGFTSGIIHVVELAILGVFTGAATFVVVIRKMFLNILLPIGYLVMPLALIPSLRHWAKNWIFLVIETAAVVIPLSLIMSMSGKTIQLIFLNSPLDDIKMVIIFLAILLAGIALVLGAATLTHNLLHGSVANLSSMVAAGGAAATGKAAGQMRQTTHNVAAGAQAAKQGAADYKASRMHGPGYQNPYMNNQGDSRSSGGGYGKGGNNTAGYTASNKMAYTVGKTMGAGAGALKGAATRTAQNFRRRTGNV